MSTKGNQQPQPLVLCNCFSLNSMTEAVWHTLGALLREPRALSGEWGSACGRRLRVYPPPFAPRAIEANPGWLFKSFNESARSSRSRNPPGLGRPADGALSCRSMRTLLAGAGYGIRCLLLNAAVAQGMRRAVGASLSSRWPFGSTATSSSSQCRGPCHAPRHCAATSPWSGPLGRD